MARIVIGLLMLVISSVAMGQSPQHVKCEASINGFKIRTVYIMGDQYNGVVWAYKHIAEETCLTPTTDINKADAILEVDPIVTPGTTVDGGPATVSCTSTKDSTFCSDSTGNELIVDCSRDVCTSSYGPNPASAIAGAFNAWIDSRWFESTAQLYTADHKLLWRSEDQKAHWTDQWPDKLRYGTNSPPCKIPASGSWDRHKYKNYRNWGIQNCGIEFDPMVSIDLKLLNHQAAERQKLGNGNKDEMLQNAHEAAAKQQQQQVTPK